MVSRRFIPLVPIPKKEGGRRHQRRPPPKTSWLLGRCSPTMLSHGARSLRGPIFPPIFRPGHLRCNVQVSLGQPDVRRRRRAAFSFKIW
jgi:hypothetical protein